MTKKFCSKFKGNILSESSLGLFELKSSHNIEVGINQNVKESSLLPFSSLLRYLQRDDHQQVVVNFLGAKTKQHSVFTFSQKISYVPKPFNPNFPSNFCKNLETKTSSSRKIPFFFM